MVCHTLIIEVGERVVLVDTGIGRADIDAPGRLGRAFDRVVNPSYDPDETLAGRIEGLGYRTADVSDIVLTHLDPDHAGGIADFPHARAHVSEPEHDAATARRDAQSRARYAERQIQSAHRWVLYPVDRRPWFGLEAAAQLDIDGLDAVLVWLPGHTVGHCGVAIRRGDRWLLHAGDTYYDRVSLRTDATAPLGLRLFARAAAWDHRVASASLASLRDLHVRRGGDIDIVCSHDAAELAAAQSR